MHLPSLQTRLHSPSLQDHQQKIVPITSNPKINIPGPVSQTFHHKYTCPICPNVTNRSMSQFSNSPFTHLSYNPNLESPCPICLNVPNQSSYTKLAVPSVSMSQTLLPTQKHLSHLSQCPKR